MKPELRDLTLSHSLNHHRIMTPGDQSARRLAASDRRSVYANDETDDLLLVARVSQKYQRNIIRDSRVSAAIAATFLTR
jgi:hypothetical protein